jgi:hypothetical protein
MGHKDFLIDLAQRRGNKTIGHEATRFVELDGGVIVEPTAFEPDPATHHDSHYYNAITNVLYKKVVTRKEPGIVVAHWQKVSY